MIAARLMPDPPSATGHILTREQLTACVRVLHSFSTPRCASVVLTFDRVDSDAYIACTRAGYLRTPDAPARGSFRWNKITITDAGRVYLDQIGGDSR